MPLTWALLIGAVVVAVVILVLVAPRKIPVRSRWGVWPDDQRAMGDISRYFTARSAGSGVGIDDRTWTDLTMDGVFSVVDRAESLLGQQILYARLRSGGDSGTRASFEALVSRFESDEPTRTSARATLGRIRRVDGQDVWSLTQPGAFDARPWHVLFPVAGAGMLAAILLTPTYPGLVFVIIAGAIAGLVLRATAARHLRVAASAFRQINPLLRVASELRALHAPETRTICEPLVSDLGALTRLRSVAAWMGRDSSGAAAGDLGALVIEYLNLLLFLDGNAVFFGSRQLRAHGGALCRVLHAVGEIDAAQSVAAYRAGTPGWTRPVFVPPGATVVFRELRHPLVADAVPNSLLVTPPGGAIITGSNMSGKTTFLRTIGVAAVMAQTINTCLSERYEAPPFVVRSCIGRADEPQSGRSYYLVEVDAVLELVRTAERQEPHLLLFDELFRGTNTVERIAAGEAVLMSLVEGESGGAVGPHVIVTATHDQELVDLVHGIYDSYHFSDAVDTAGLAFDYRLREGPAVGRNAIALLKVRGAPARLVVRAIARADVLDAARTSAGAMTRVG